MKIAIIDDEYASRSELKFLITQYMPNVVFGESISGQEGLEMLLKEKYDVAFIDIHLGDMEGIVLAKLIKSKQPDIKIIFATAFDQYAAQAFDIDATDYILKPFDPIRLNESLKRIQAEGAGSGLTDKLTVMLDKKTIVIDTEDVAFIESQGRYCIIHVKEKELKSIQSLGSFESKLSSKSFFRVHKSFLVNLNYISEITPWVNGAMSVILNGHQNLEIPVSRNRAKILKEIYHI